MSYKYTVYFEGTSEVTSDEPLTEDEIFDKAYDNIYGDSWTRLNTHSGIEQFELIDITEEEDD